MVLQILLPVSRKYFTSPFNNMRTMEFKTLSIMENVCFAAVNHAGTDLSGNKLDKCDFWEGLKGHFSEL